MSMQITIDDRELDSLKAQLRKKHEEVKKLEHELKELNKDSVKAKIQTLSWILFDRYMASVFQGLGFKLSWNGFAIERYQYFDWDKFQKSPHEFVFDIEASVSKEFCRAFLMIGAIPPSIKSNDEDWFKQLENSIK